MIYLLELYVLIGTLFLAGKDATSYLLKTTFSRDSLTLDRIKRWHRDGAILWLLYVIAAAYIAKDQWWFILISSGLIRLSIFDLAFNKWANLDIHHLGSTAAFDKFFSGIFGTKGAIKKSLFFFITLIVFNVVKLFI